MIAGIDTRVNTNADQRPTNGWVGPPPGAPQSLSPFESHTTTLIVLWLTLVLSSLGLLIWCTIWP